MNEIAKRAAAREALAYVSPDEVLGLGSGSTVAVFVDALAHHRVHPPAVVAASKSTAEQLETIGVEVVALESVGRVRVYIDGADEIDPFGRMIKGGGGAHTAEKRIAEACELFVCVVDESKLAPSLGGVPVPLEVTEEAVWAVSAAIAAFDARAEMREGFRTDSGNPILDVFGLRFSEPELLEDALNALPGVIECGVFARRRADVALVGYNDSTARRVDI